MSGNGILVAFLSDVNTKMRTPVLYYKSLRDGREIIRRG